MIRKKTTGIILKKIKCEICDFDKKRNLHIHHIIPRADPRCTNNLNNLAVLCPTCHSLVHTGDITIIGVYPSTGLNSRTLMFFYKDKEPPLEREFWKILPENNPFVIYRQ